MRLVKILAAIGLFNIVTACVPEFNNPVTNVGEQAVDTKLLGTWYAVKKNDSHGFFHIGLDKTKQQYLIQSVSFETDGSLKLDVYSAHNSQVGDKNYLNVRAVGEVPQKDKSKGYALVRYEKGYMLVRYGFEKNSLRLALAKSEPFKAEITNKKLLGNTEKGTVINDTAENIQAFLTSHEDKDIFGELATLTKLVLPEPKAPAK